MKKKYLGRLSLYVALGLFQFVGYSYSTPIAVTSTTQTNPYGTQLPFYKPLNDYGSFVIRMDQKTNLTAEEFVAKAIDFFGLNETNSFQLIHSYTDIMGQVHQTYQHIVGQYAVEGQMFIVHSNKNGRVTSVNGTIINIENKKSVYTLKEHVDSKVIISKEKAISIAFQANKITENAKTDYPVETVFVKSMKHNKAFVLAHKVRIDNFSSSQIQSKNVFVGVEKGDIVHEVSLLAHIDVQGRGDGFYRANLPLGLRLENDQYQLIDGERNIRTLDATQSTNLWEIYSGMGSVFTYATSTFPKNPANDIHWGLSKTYDYYWNVHHRHSYDAQGGEIVAFYNPIIMDGDRSGFPNNAVAISSFYNVMIFGRGGDTYNPLTGLDVVGHEFTHLVVNSNGRGGLVYQGESGALNEGFADIFGTSIEHYSVDDADWFIGTGVIKGPIHFMRSMSDPKEGREQSRQPNTYQGEYWVDTNIEWDSGGVHYNSGVINYWYYLLSEGGMGVNDIGNEYTVTGIGMQKAEQIAYLTLMTQLGSNSQYIDAVEGALTVTANLYGADSAEYYAVYDAWYAVGFGEKRPNMGVEDFELAADVFSLYPNPVTNGELTVVTKDDKGVVAFYNMAGQKVTQDFTVERGENKLNILQLKTGNYIVIYESRERKISEKIIVK
ncbi:M4 family metallopeptidase [Myroides odoratus]|uniref:Bacillolysin n=1 Tax=Myroides odoratus TaxID=256 RepID=A0A378RHZ7_MYROD|nr:M4 family metallopeptidase [Myroides odoratus]QQU02469.1 M4 family metallopeptidase [Myroides odoratus]STZ26585.1 Bacillolysin precursor [Myroides odoratus]